MRVRTAKRVLGWTLGAGAALFVLLILASNLMLRTRLLRSLVSKDPDSTMLDYARAYSWFPTHPHIEGLVLRGRDTNVEWELKIEHADFRVSLSDLFRRRFRATHVRADGVTFDTRFRESAADPKHDPKVPEIDGFPKPPLTDIGPPEAPPTDANYKLWSVDLEDVDVTRVHEVWIDTVRIHGIAHVHGRWFFRPVRWLEVGPATIDGDTLAITDGDRVIVREVRGAIATTIHPFDLRTMKEAPDLLAHVAVNADLHGDLSLAAMFGEIAPSVFDDSFQLTHSGAHFDAHVIFDDSHGFGDARVRTTELELRSPESTTIAANVDASFAVTEFRTDVAKLTFADVKAEAHDVTFQPSRFASPHAIEAPSVEFSSKEIALNDHALHGQISLAIPHVQVDDVTPIVGAIALPKNLRIDGGRAGGSIHGALDLATLGVNGRAAIVVRALKVHVGDQAMTGDLVVDARARSKGTAIELEGSTLAFDQTGAEPAKRWWARVAVKSGEIDHGSRFRAFLQATARDATPAAAFLASRTVVPEWIARALAAPTFSVEGELRGAPSTFEARGVCAKSGAETIDLEYKSHGDANEAIAFFRLGVIRATLDAGSNGTRFVLVDAEPYFEAERSRIRWSER